jgi:hypothetical protein
MTTSQKLSSLLQRARPWSRRVLCFLFIFSFLLPYVDVKGCTTKTTGTYYGYDLIQGGSAVLYLTAIGIFLLLLLLSFLVRKGSASFTAFAAGWRAMAAATAGVIVLLFPGLDFLFDTVFMGPGQLVSVVTAALVFIDGAADAAVGYARLRRESPAGPSLSGGLAKYHAAIIGLALALVPAYAIALWEEVGLTVTYFVILTAPFVLSQLIVMEGVKREEQWTRRWAPGVAVVMAAAVVMIVLGYL